MEGTIVNFRRGRHNQKPSHIIIKVKDVDTRKKAEELIGKQATWKSPAEKVISGKVEALHGNSGAVRAIFERGLPGQALGKKLELK
ncbi:MAG: 50S ribosomal protein L35ae [Candidatus Woesearchaeota archaeon]